MTTSRLPALLLAAAFGSALSALALLGGCAGDDDTPSITARADTATVTWNITAAIDVLANDSVSSGDKRLMGVVRQPANGSATVADGRIGYRPRDGFYGTDTLRYAMASTDGTAAAEAEVAITVEAELLISGRAIDAPLAQAAVQISGAASAAAVTDAQGLWQARVRLSDPNGVLRIDARGTGAQQHVHLTGLAATIALVTAAAADGTVSADSAAAPTVSHFSTAQTALIIRMLDGLPMGTTLTLAQNAVDAMALLDLATLIHMVADEGLTLPDGKADTWALAQDPGAVAALLAAQQTGDGAAFTAARGRAQEAEPSAGVLPMMSMLATYAPNSLNTEGEVFLLLPGGASQTTTAEGSREGHWTLGPDGVVITLDNPISTTSFSAELDPLTLLQSQQRDDTTGYRVKLLPGRLVTVSTARIRTTLDGSRAGQVEVLNSLADPGGARRLIIEPRASMPLLASDFATGRRWAGVRTLTQNQAQVADLLEITAPGVGRTLLRGANCTVQLQGASFILSCDDGRRHEYLRLTNTGGAVIFMLFDRSDGKPLTARVAVLVPQADAPLLDAATASRAWELDLGDGSIPGKIVLRADGTGSYLGGAANWQVLANGRVEIVRNRRQVGAGNTVRTIQTRYHWIPLRQDVDGAFWVLRGLANGEDPAAPWTDDAPGMFWSLFRYRDTGPAS